MVEVKTEKGTEVFPILIMVSKDIQLFLGLNWLDKLKISQQGEKNTNIIRNMDNDERQKTLGEYANLFKSNHTIKYQTKDIQLKKKTLNHYYKKEDLYPSTFKITIRQELERLIERDTKKKRTKQTKTVLYALL